MLQTHARKTCTSVDMLRYEYKVTDIKWTSDDVSSDKDVHPNITAFQVSLNQNKKPKRLENSQLMTCESNF